MLEERERTWFNSLSVKLSCFSSFYYMPQLCTSVVELSLCAPTTTTIGNNHVR